MQRHLQHHHSTVLKSTTAPVKKTSQTTLTNTFGPQLPQSSVRATAITRDIGVFIAADMRPFSVVENQGFRRLLHTLDPKYTIPPRTHFTRLNLPKRAFLSLLPLFQKAKQFFLERIFTLEDATDEAPESVVTAVCEILQDHSVDLLDRCKKRSRLFNIKTPKLSFKKQKNKEDPKTVLSKMRMEENPVPTGPKPKKKNGVSAFFRGVWRRVSLTCISSGSNKIHPVD
ncbi:hypothetical protein SRHO_G00212360 [Serrasalmus rhombeus]